MRWGLIGVDRDFGESFTFGEAEHGFQFRFIQRGAIGLIEVLIFCWIFLYSSKIYYMKFSIRQQENHHLHIQPIQAKI